MYLERFYPIGNWQCVVCASYVCVTTPRQLYLFAVLYPSSLVYSGAAPECTNVRANVVTSAIK